MRKTWWSALAASLLLSSFAAPSVAQDPRTQLLTAAAQASIPLHTQELMVLTHGAKSFAVAPIQGFENIPATALASGVDMAYAYINFPGSSVPAGSYKLRGRAPSGSIRAGEYDGTLELIDSYGNVAASLPMTINTFSTTVPNPLPYPRTMLKGAWVGEDDLEGPSFLKAGRLGSLLDASPELTTPSDKMYNLQSPYWWSPFRWVTLVFICPNGSIFFVSILLY